MGIVGEWGAQPINRLICLSFLGINMAPGTLQVDPNSDRFKKLHERRVANETEAAARALLLKSFAANEESLNTELTRLLAGISSGIDPVRLTQLLVRAPSVVDTDGEMLLSKALGLGIKNALPQAYVTVDKYGNVIATLKPIDAIIREHNPILLLNGHIDVVQPDARDSVYSYSGAKLPGKRVRDDGEEMVDVIYGRGATDMKSGIAVALCLFRDMYFKDGKNSKIQPMVVLDTMEEHGDIARKGFFNFVNDTSGDFKSLFGYMISFEPAVQDGTQCCCIASSGRCLYKITIPTEGREVEVAVDTLTGEAAHASTPHLGKNPLAGLEEGREVLSLQMGTSTPDGRISSANTNVTPNIALVGLRPLPGETTVKMIETPAKFIVEFQRELGEESKKHLERISHLSLNSTFTMTSAVMKGRDLEIIVDARAKGTLNTETVKSIIEAAMTRAKSKSSADFTPSMETIAASNPHTYRGSILLPLVLAEKLPIIEFTGSVVSRFLPAVGESIIIGPGDLSQLHKVHEVVGVEDIRRNYALIQRLLAKVLGYSLI